MEVSDKTAVMMYVFFGIAAVIGWYNFAVASFTYACVLILGGISNIILR